MYQMWTNLKIKKERMMKLVTQNQITALDLAELLVRKGLAFRQAHFLVGQLVRQTSEQNNLSWQNLSADYVIQVAQKVLGKKLELTQPELSSAIDPAQSVASRNVTGGPAPEQTKIVLDKHRCLLKTFSAQITSKREKIRIANQKLQDTVAELTH